RRPHRRRLGCHPRRRPRRDRRRGSGPPHRAPGQYLLPAPSERTAIMIGVAVIGYGYWGPNLVRNFADIPQADLRWVCDLQTERLARLRSRYPAVQITEDIEDVLNDPKVDAVAIATPVSSHFALAMRCLKAGKSVFVEKPITATAEEARRLNDEADRRGLVVAVDHTFIHTGAVKKLRDIIQNDLGELYYCDAARGNLGVFQHDVSVIWDLPVHALPIRDFVSGAHPG